MRGALAVAIAKVPAFLKSNGFTARRANWVTGIRIKTVMAAQTMDDDANRRSRRGVPSAVLVAACLTLLAWQHRNDTFCPPHSMQATVTSHGISIAENLAFDHALLMYRGVEVDPDGTLKYDVYNRFPLASFGIIKLAMLPAGDSICDKIYFARQAMNLCFIGAVILFFLILCEIGGNAWLALAATLTASTSYYFHYYADLVDVGLPAMLGFALLLHGVIRYECGGTRRGLAWRTLVAITLGWQALSVLGAWLAFTMGRRWIGRGERERFWAIPAVRLATLGVGWAVVQLGFNLTIEALATGGAPTATLKSALYRLGLREGEGRVSVHWSTYAHELYRRFAAGVLPHPIREWISPELHRRLYDGPRAMTMVSLIALPLAGIALARWWRVDRRRRLTIALLAVSAGPWFLLMKNYVYPHEFESMYAVTAVLAIFWLVWSLVPRSLYPVLGVLAAIGFAHATWRWNEIKDTGTVRIAEDFQRIRDAVAPGRTVACEPQVAQAWYAREFFLAGRLFASREQADYTVLKWRAPTWRVTLTPTNRHFFLYQRRTLTIWQPARGPRRIRLDRGADAAQQAWILLPSRAGLASGAERITPDDVTTRARAGELGYAPRIELDARGCGEFSMPASIDAEGRLYWQAFRLGKNGELTQESNVVLIDG